MNDIYDILKMEKDEIKKHKNNLEQKYSEEFKDYISNVSTKKMCISFNIMQLMTIFINKYNFTSIADLGSGFSTYYLKKLVSEKEGIKLVSADHDEEWLRKTKQFLTKYETDTDNLMTTKEFVKYTNRNKLQLVLFDTHHMSNGSRGKYYKKIAKNLKNAVIVFDDMHKEVRANEIIELAEEQGMEICTAKFSKDKYKRFAYVAIPKSKEM